MGVVDMKEKVMWFQRNWKAITSDQWVLNCVQGYEIEWVARPSQICTPRELVFPKAEADCLSAEIESLLQKEAISPICPPFDETTSEHGFVSQLFAVPKKDGGIRPVVNLKALNSHVQQVPFKMEGIHLLKDILRPGDWMTKVDLKDAYFSIPVSSHDRKFLRFRWQGKMYQFNCLPFGLSSAPWIFTKATKPVVTILRTLGMRIIIYIDDILVMAPSKELAQEHTECLIFLLENLGFTVNRQKSLTDPTQEIEFLGLVADSVLMELRLPGSKIKNIRSDAKALLQMVQPTAREVSRLLGKLTHATHAMRAAPLFFRHLQACLQAALQPLQDYSQHCPLTKEAKEDLNWWATHPTSWNGKSIIRGNPDLTIETDASNTGWGARCGSLQTGGPWSPTEARMHINCLELLAATLAIQAFAKKQENILVHLKMDSTSALTYINKMGGTVSPNLNRLTKDLWTWCLARNITLRAYHLPGALNEKADEESRIMKDRSDWMLCRETFRRIQTQFGPLDIDLFASRLTKQLPTYVSWRPDPQALETDAFSMNWKGLKAYANPPWHLISRVLCQVREQEATIVLVAPVWKTQAWYSLLLELLIETPLRLPRTKNLIQPTHPVNCPDIQPHLAVWRISGQDSLQREFRLRLQASCLPHGERSLAERMTRCSASGLAGVSNGTLIPFQEISQVW